MRRNACDPIRTAIRHVRRLRSQDRRRHRRGKQVAAGDGHPCLGSGRRGPASWDRPRRDRLPRPRQGERSVSSVAGRLGQGTRPICAGREIALEGPLQARRIGQATPARHPVLQGRQRRPDGWRRPGARHRLDPGSAAKLQRIRHRGRRISHAPVVGRRGPAHPPHAGRFRDRPAIHVRLADGPRAARAPLVARRRDRLGHHQRPDDRAAIIGDDRGRPGRRPPKHVHARIAERDLAHRDDLRDAARLCST